MKTAIFALLLSLPVWAIPRGATCQMHSRGNEAAVVMEVTGQKVSVKVGEASAEECALVENNSYDLLARCGGSDEDATFFGVRRNAGRVYGNEIGTIAELKNCRLQN